MQIGIINGDINITVPFTAVCGKKGTTHTVNFLDCDKTYNVIPFWMSDSNKWCPLQTAITDMKVPCPSGINVQCYY